MKQHPLHPLPLAAHQLLEYVFLPVMSILNLLRGISYHCHSTFPFTFQAMRILLFSPHSSVDQDEGDSCPAPEDEEFFQGPDPESKEEAINKFLDGMKDQERSGFKGIDRLLGRLPVPGGKEIRSMSHSEARAGDFLPDMDAEEQKRFTPSELLIYKHALEYRYEQCT